MKKSWKRRLYIGIICLLFIQGIWSYKYNLSKYSGGSFSDYDSSGVSLSMGYGGNGSGAMVTRQGVLFPQGQLLSAGGSKINFEPNAQKTAWFTLYAFTVAQYSTLFGYFSSGTGNFYLTLMLNNGYTRIETNQWDGSNMYALTTVQSSSSSMYKVGWNLLWYADTTQA